MKNSVQILKKAPLFKGVREDDFDEMLETLDSQLKNYRGKQIIVSQGRSVRRAGLLLEGSVSISRSSFWNERELLEQITPGMLFAENYAMSRGSVSQVTMEADCASVVLWFSIREILSFDGSKSFHNVVIRNLMYELAEKNLSLNEKIVHTTKHTTREKILSYLSSQAFENHSDEFDIPFDRKQLAEYLSLDRSAMSAQLSKLSKEGYFVTKKNHFHLLHPESQNQTSQHSPCRSI